MALTATTDRCEMASLDETADYLRLPRFEASCNDTPQEKFNAVRPYSGCIGVVTTRGARIILGLDDAKAFYEWLQVNL